MSNENFNEKTIQKIANLARLRLTDSEAIELSSQLAKVITHFNEIAQLNTQNIEPLITPTQIDSVWRNDAVEQNLTAEEIIANAPDKLGNLFKVPPVV